MKFQIIAFFVQLKHCWFWKNFIQHIKNLNKYTGKPWLFFYVKSQIRKYNWSETEGEDTVNRHLFIQQIFLKHILYAGTARSWKQQFMG